MEVFESCMPLVWPLNVRKNIHLDQKAHESTCFPLPPAIGGQWAHPQMRDACNSRKTSLLFKQQEKLDSDWAAVSKAFPEASFKDYMYYWLVVNSRGFYWEFPGEVLPENHLDRLVLAPWIDLFNHSDHGCNVSFDEAGYVITSDKAYST